MIVDVIVPRRAGASIDGIRVHEVRPPRATEIGSVNGIPCTSAARTLVDLAGVVGSPTLRSCFERAAARGALDLAAVEAVGFSGRRGAPALRRLIAEWRPATPVLTRKRLRSVLEAKVLPLLARRDLPMPDGNAPVELAEGRIEVDFLWPERRFVLEADSRAFHATEAAAERDRWRDRELLRAGYSTLRVTHAQVEREAEAIAETVAVHLRRDRR